MGYAKRRVGSRGYSSRGVAPYIFKYSVDLENTAHYPLISDGTYSRASSATYKDSSGVLQTASSGTARTSHYVTANDSTEYRTFLHEPQSKNKLLQSEDITTTWADVGTPVESADASAAPDGNTTVDTSEDDSAAAHEGHSQAITVTDDSTSWTLSVFVPKTSSASSFPGISLDFTGGTGVSYSAAIDTDDGAVTSQTGETVDASTVEDFNSNFWRVSITGANNGTGNTTLTAYLYDAVNTDHSATWDVSTTGTASWWGMQLENKEFLTSYIKTTTAEVSRAADSLYFTFPPPPQEMTVYMSQILVKAPNSNSHRMWHIGGGSFAVDPRLFLGERSGGQLRLDHDNNSSVVNAQSSATPSRFDKVESRSILRADGSVQLGLSANEGAEDLASQSSANALQSAWAESEFWVGGIEGSSTHQNSVMVLAIVVAKGVKSMAEMRSLAGE